MIEQWDFIRDVARDIGISKEAFRKWRVRGVPPVHRLAIVDEAARCGFDLDRAAFDSPPGSVRSQRQAAE